MVDNNRTNVVYNALADFSALKREARAARREIAGLKAAEKAYNAESARSRTASTQASQRRSKAVTAELAAYRSLTQVMGRYARNQAQITTSVRAGTEAIKAQSRALQTNTTRLLAAAAAARAYAQSQQGISRNANTAASAIRQNSPLERRANTAAARPALPSMSAAQAAAQYANNAKRAERESTRWGRAVNFLETRIKALPPAMDRAHASSTRLQRGFQKFTNWRPKLTPPFVALIPIIASVVAAINPLVSLLGAVGVAAFGLTSNIASLSGAFLALPGILSAVVAGITSVIASMGGVGNVFKTYAAMKKATGTGAGGESAADRADRLADAEANLARSQRNVKKAQDALNRAREEALRDLQDLRKEVSRASLDESRAIADLQSARDAYNNVMADPSSQAGDKLDAAVRIKEAEADLADVRQRNIDNQKALNEAEAKGVEQSDRVLDAQENLEDAVRSQRDAQKDLTKAQVAGGAAGVAAANEYNEALSKLSPSAQKVVLALIAMGDTWNAMKLGVQEAFFSNIVGDMDKLPSIIDTIGSVLRPAADAMGRFTHNFLEMFDSPAWKQDMATIGQNNVGIIDNLGGAFLNLATFFKDLMLAAAPFTDWLTGAFEDGMGNLSALIDTDPEKQGLAAWLEKVRGRLEKWWQIVKNVASTLFNYGSAASTFGDWINDNILRMTETWKTNSEEAAKAGSPFQKFLEKISEPGGLLETANRLVGNFFQWFAEESMDPANIDNAKELLETIEVLGTAIGNFLDTLADTNIDDKIIEAITAIVDSLNEILKAGGTAGFETFMDVVVAFFEALANLLSNLEPGAVDLLLKVLGGLAGLALVGKFTGLNAAVGWLLKLDKAKFASLLGKGGLFAGLALLGGGFMGGLNEDGVQGADASAAGLGGAALGARFGGAPGAALGFVGGLGSSLVTDLTDDKDGAWNKGWDQMFKPGDFSGAGIGEIKRFITEANANIAKWRDEDLPRWWGDVTEGWTNFWKGVGDGWNKFWGEDVPTSWNNFVTGFQEGWDGFWGPIGENWDIFWTTISDGWALFWGTTIPTTWTNFTTWLSSGWNGFWNGLGTGLQSMVDWFGQIWSGLQNLFAAPINWVINSVYNDGIRRLWNDYVAKPFGWTQLGTAPGIAAAPSAQKGGGGGRGALKYREGGVLPGDNQNHDNHHFVDQHGNKLDLGGGEGILVPQAARALGGERGIAQINRDAKRQKFREGGIFGANNAMEKKRTKGTGGTPWEIAGDVWDKMSAFLNNPFGWVTDMLMGGGVRGNINALTSQSLYGGLIGRVPLKAIENLAGYGAERRKDAKRKPDPDAGATGGMGGKFTSGWQNQWAAVKAAFPNANLNDSVRPSGTRTAGGGLSYHSLGRAIDVTASMPIFNWIKENYGANSKELIYSPAGRRQVQNGREFLWGEPVRSMHYDHVHWAMRAGGILGNLPKVYDKGGWIPSGGMAVNRSGKPEAVLNPEESRALRHALSGDGLVSNRNQFGLGSQMGSLASTAQQIVDNSVNIQNLNINNPVPEEPSVSLPKAIRQIGYMQNARGA